MESQQKSYVYGGDAELESLRICLPIVGERGSLAQGLKDADIVSLYKNKTKLKKKKKKREKNLTVQTIEASFYFSLQAKS